MYSNAEKSSLDFSLKFQFFDLLWINPISVTFEISLKKLLVRTEIFIFIMTHITIEQRIGQFRS